ncbi:DUF3376 domain-containing protein [Streptomyces sp. JNUCC 64]
METSDPGPDPASPARHAKELRLALAMRGGVSLAVWMGGACQEMAALRDAAPTASPEEPPSDFYAGLLRYCDYERAEIDVLAGTSAGGLNAVLLASHLVHGMPFGSGVRDLWLRLGDLEGLLRRSRPFRVPDSLLDGDGAFHRRLRAVMGKLVARPEPSRPTPVESLRLIITSSRLHPRRDWARPSLGAPLLTGRSQAYFRFRHRATSTVTQDALTDFYDDGDVSAALDRLAYAARCSSSYPGAFEPGRPRVAAHPAGGVEAVDLRGVSSETGCPDPGLGGRVELLDGGLLDNIPVAWAVRAIAGAPVTRRPDRWLLFLQPVPPFPPTADPSGAGRGGRRVTRLLRTLGASFGMKAGAESLLDDVRELRAATAGTARQRGTARVLPDTLLGLFLAAGPRGGDHREAVGAAEADRTARLLEDPAEVTGPDPLPLPSVPGPLDALDVAGGDASVTLLAALRQHAGALVLEPAPALPPPVDELPGALRTPLGPARAVRLLMDWLRACEMAVDGPPPDHTCLWRRLYALRLVVATTVAARDRLLLHAFAAATATGVPGDPVDLVARASTRLAALRRTLPADPAEWESWAGELAGKIAIATASAPAAATASAPTSAASAPTGSAAFTASGTAASATSASGTPAPGASASGGPAPGTSAPGPGEPDPDTLGPGPDFPGQGAPGTGWPAAPYQDLWDRIAETGVEIGNVAPDGVPGFGALRTAAAGGPPLTRTALAATEVLLGALRPDPLAEVTDIRLHTVSAATRSWATDTVLDSEHGAPTTPRELVAAKLSGNQLNNFAAFLSARWRLGDWTWGRLDATASLVSVIATDERLAKRYGPVRDGAVPDEAVLIARLAADFAPQLNALLPQGGVAPPGGPPVPAPATAAELLGRIWAAAPALDTWDRVRHVLTAVRQRGVLTEELPLVRALSPDGDEPPAGPLRVVPVNTPELFHEAVEEFRKTGAESVGHLLKARAPRRTALRAGLLAWPALQPSRVWWARPVHLVAGLLKPLLCLGPLLVLLAPGRTALIAVALWTAVSASTDQGFSAPGHGVVLALVVPLLVRLGFLVFRGRGVATRLTVSGLALAALGVTVFLLSRVTTAFAVEGGAWGTAVSRAVQTLTSSGYVLTDRTSWAVVTGLAYALAVALPLYLAATVRWRPPLCAVPLGIVPGLLVAALGPLGSWWAAAVLYGVLLALTGLFPWVHPRRNTDQSG